MQQFFFCCKCFDKCFVNTSLLFTFWTFMTPSITTLTHDLITYRTFSPVKLPKNFPKKPFPKPTVRLLASRSCLHNQKETASTIMLLKPGTVSARALPSQKLSSLKPLNTIVLWWSKGFQGRPQLTLHDAARACTQFSSNAFSSNAFLSRAFSSNPFRPILLG